MAQIRQEINILDNPLTTTNGTLTSVDTVLLDTTKYNGTVTYYFEAEANNGSGAGSAEVYLRRKGTTTDDASITGISSTTQTLFRSSSFTPPAGQTEYVVFWDVTGLASSTAKSARIIIIQSATPITNTETQIEIGNRSSTINLTDTALTNPKYWQYTSANWNGTITAYFESTFLTGTSKSAATMTLQTSTSITAPSWSNVTGTAVTTTSTTGERVRSSAFTLTAGNWYRAVMKAGNSKSGITTYNAKIIIDQISPEQATDNTGTSKILAGGSSGSSNERLAQSFTASATQSVTGVVLSLKKTNSPTDTINVILCSTQDGSTLASGSISSSTLTTSLANYTITFSSPYTVTSGNTYFIELVRSPDTNDTTNTVSWGASNVDTGYTGGTLSRRLSGSWSNEAVDSYFKVLGDGITKLEPQYLLANTLFLGGTSLQVFLTKWDSTEWSSVTNTYYFQAEAADNSTSDVTLEEADGGGTVTNSTVTNVDNAQISAAMTMPASENLDTKATTNAGDVAAARILVALSVDAGTTTSTSSTSSSSTSTSSTSSSSSTSSTSTSSTSSSSSTSSTSSSSSTSTSSTSSSTSSTSSSSSTSTTSTSTSTTSTSTSSTSSSSSTSSTSSSSSTSSTSSSSSTSTTSTSTSSTSSSSSTSTTSTSTSSTSSSSSTSSTSSSTSTSSTSSSSSTSSTSSSSSTSTTSTSTSSTSSSSSTSSTSSSSSTSSTSSSSSTSTTSTSTSSTSSSSSTSSTSSSSSTSSTSSSSSTSSTSSSSSTSSTSSSSSTSSTSSSSSTSSTSSSSSTSSTSSSSSTSSTSSSSSSSSSTSTTTTLSGETTTSTSSTSSSTSTTSSSSSTSTSSTSSSSSTSSTTSSSSSSTSTTSTSTSSTSSSSSSSTSISTSSSTSTTQTIPEMGIDIRFDDMSFNIRKK